MGEVDGDDVDGASVGVGVGCNVGNRLGGDVVGFGVGAGGDIGERVKGFGIVTVTVVPVVSVSGGTGGTGGTGGGSSRVGDDVGTDDSASSSPSDGSFSISLQYSHLESHSVRTRT